MTMPLKKWLTAALIAGIALGSSGCVRHQPEITQTPVPFTSADTTGSGPGSLVSAVTLPNIDDSIRSVGATAVKVIYRSTNGIDGTPTEVSGTVFESNDAAPAGGRKAVVLAHGTSGILEECAPSRSSDLAGMAGGVASFLKLGFAVAVPDYQGLGAPGAHPYLDSTTAAYNVIDSVKALRATFGDVSSEWAAYGGSQGGGATWAANEQAGQYGNGLDLVGTISAVPAANFVPYVDLAEEQKLSPDQMAAYIWVLMGIERTRPDFQIDLYRSGTAEKYWDVLSGCAGEKGVKRNAALKEVSSADLVPANAQAARSLKKIMAEMGVPQRRADAPMLVFYGGKDEFFDPAWTRGAIRRACEKGSVIEAVYQPNKGHGDIDTSSFVEWLGDRFSGKTPVPNNCAIAKGSVSARRSG